MCTRNEWGTTSGHRKAGTRDTKTEGSRSVGVYTLFSFNNNNNKRLVTLAEHTSDHGKQTTQAQKQRGSRARKLLGANAKSYRLKLIYFLLGCHKYPYLF